MLVQLLLSPAGVRAGGMGTGGLLAGLPGMATPIVAAISGKPTTTTCLYSPPPPITNADSSHAALAVATISGDGMKTMMRGRSATRPPQRSSSLQFVHTVGNLDAARVEERTDSEVAKGYHTMTQFCDEMIELYEKPEPKDWGKLLVFRDEWNKYTGSFYELLQVQADTEKEATIKNRLLSLAGKIKKVALDRRCMETEALVCQEKDLEFDACLSHFKRLLLHRPGFGLPTSYIEEKASSVVSDTNEDAEIEKQSMVKDSFNGVIPSEVLALAKEAVLASQEAESLAESHSTDHVNGFYSPGQDSKDLAKVPVRVEAVTVRSKQFLERRSKRRRMPNKMSTVISDAAACPTSKEMSRKISKGVDMSDPLRLFLWGPQTKQLLTVKEEWDLFNKIQDLMRLEEVKQELHLQFGREPTLSEWAEAVGMSNHVLQSCLYSGNCSREKMIYANFRLVVHVSKQYQGKGLSIQDLLQEGSMGLMRSLEKFKPTAGCRFPTYAYWWIRQSIRKAIFQNSRTIRLPENVFALLKKIKNVRKLYIQEGHIPSNEEVARRVGITKERLERLLTSSRTPVSIQDSAWIDQDITFQEITADPEVEVPELSVAKQMMRQHVRSLLRALPSRERQIIQFRYGIHDGVPKSLSDIGALLGLSKERIRQLESRALDRLKEGLTSHGLGAYVDLLV